MVGGLERGERSEEELRAGKLISSWAYTAKPGDSSVDCFAVNQEGKVESSASIAFVVKEEQVVTLRNIEDKRKVENNNNVRKTASVEDNLDKVEVEKEDAGAVDKLDVADVDAVDRLAGFAAAAPEEQFFDAGEQLILSRSIGNIDVMINPLENIATGETSPAITPYHTYHFSISTSLTFITSKLPSQDDFHHLITFTTR